MLLLVCAALLVAGVSSCKCSNKKAAEETTECTDCTKACSDSTATKACCDSTEASKSCADCEKAGTEDCCKAKADSCADCK